MQFSPTWGLFLRKVRIFPGQFWKINTQSITFSKYVLSYKFPTDTQSAILTSKLEEFYRDSQNISVKSREHSSKNSLRNPKNFFSSRWGPLWWNWLTILAKTKSFLVKFRNSRNYQFYWGETSFLTKKFLCLHRFQF